MGGGRSLGRNSHQRFKARLESHIATNLFGIPKMDMVQVKDLDGPVVGLVRSLQLPNDLPPPRRGSRWNEYRLSQELVDILRSFAKFHGTPIKEGLPARQGPGDIKEKSLIQFLANDGFSVVPNTLVVLIPLFNSSTCAKYRTGMGEWHALRWVPGTFIRVPSGRVVSFDDPQSVYSLMVEFTWEAANV